MRRGVKKYEHRGMLYTREQARQFGRTCQTEDQQSLMVTTPFGHTFWMHVFLGAIWGQTEVQG